MKRRLSFATAVLALSSVIATSALAGGSNEVEIKLIHMGDVHGHLIPRPNVRSDGDGRMEGGLARMYTKIQSIRGDGRKALLINTGDTIQGSAEALYTRGQALVDVINLFKIDAFAPGNWEFVYGTERFRELFAGVNGAAPTAPWGAVAANVYYDGAANPAYAAFNGQPVLPKYKIIPKNGVKVGILGFTTDRGPQVVGSAVTNGFRFLSSAPGSANDGTDASAVEAELRARIAELRPQVDLLVVASELGLANNIILAERNAGIDVILSSDMHEETRKPVVTSTGTIIVEEGQDGTMIGELEFEFNKDRRTGKLTLKEWEWKPHTINDSISENSTVKSKVAAVRAPFVKATTAKTYVNPFNGSTLAGRIDEVVGYTAVPLHRTSYSDESMPAVVEGSGHDFLTDAFRTIGIKRFGAEMDAGTRPADVIGAIRGFRYGTHIKPGPIKREDIYHFVAIGPKIACGTIPGGAVKNQMENAADGSLNPDPRRWTGGWLFNFSGLISDLYPVTGATYDANGNTVGALNRVRNIQIQNKDGNYYPWVATGKSYTYCSYFYDNDPNLINRVTIPNPATISVIKDDAGNAMDGVEVVVEYLKDLPGMTADPVLNRTTLMEPMPAFTTPNKEVQPWGGAKY